MARPIGLVRSVTALLVATLVTGACGASRARVAPPAADVCALVPPASALVDSASIVVTSPVDARNVLRPMTWGERFVFDLVSDTVTLRDCRGQALAARVGPYRMTDLGRSTLLLEPGAGASGPRLTIRSATETDARDLIDAGTDLLLTESPALARYAAARSNVSSVPLGWNRTWVVVTALPGRLGLDSSSTLRSELARDVVPADAREAAGPFWWTNVDGCGHDLSGGARGASQSPGTSRVVYPRDEPIARALAERIVALAGAGTVATGLAPNAFASTLRAGGELAYVMPLPRRPSDRCAAASALMAAAPWIGKSPDVITPLIDTRLVSVIERDRLNLTLTSDSTIAISPRRP